MIENHKVLKLDNNNSLLRLELSQQDLSVAVRKGNDLHLVLQNGEILIIQDYFLYPNSSLILTKGSVEQLLSFTVENSKGFIVSDYSSAVAAADQGLLTGKWMLIGGGALAVAGGAMAAGGGGGGGDSAGTPPVNQKAVLSSADVKVNETDIPLIVTGRLSIKDSDSPETFVVQSNVAGQFGTFSIDASGQWSYKATSAHNKLSYNESIAESFTVYSADGTETKVKITINGSNDIPVISGADTGNVKEDLELMTSGQLLVSDPDERDSHTWRLDTDSAALYGVFSINNQGKWTYHLNNQYENVQSLGQGEVLTDRQAVTVTDSAGGQVTKVLTIRIEGVNDTPLISGEILADIKEDTEQMASGQLLVEDTDVHDTHTWRIENGNSDLYGTFSINSQGQWTYSLNNKSLNIQSLGQGETISLNGTVAVNDGHGGEALKDITVRIEGVNDAPVIREIQDEWIKADQEEIIYGEVESDDIDQNDSASWSTATKGQYGSFTINSNGEWQYKLDKNNKDIRALNVDEELKETITVKVSDNHGGVAERQFNIDIQGVNDNPVISGDEEKTVSQDYNATVSGQLYVTDVDHNDTFQWQYNGAGLYGTLTINAQNQWTYIHDNPSPEILALKEGEFLQDNFYIQAIDGNNGTDEIEVRILISGRNDDPVVMSESTYQTDNNSSLDIYIDAVDPEDDLLVYDVFPLPEHGRITQENLVSSAFTYTADSGFVGTDTFDVIVSDGNGGGTKQTIFVNVTGSGTEAGSIPLMDESSLFTVLSQGYTEPPEADATDMDVNINALLSETDSGSVLTDISGNYAYLVGEQIIHAAYTTAKSQHVLQYFELMPGHSVKINENILSSYF